jgi:transcription antitermination factor NusG
MMMKNIMEIRKNTILFLILWQLLMAIQLSMTLTHGFVHMTPSILNSRRYYGHMNDITIRNGVRVNTRLFKTVDLWDRMEISEDSEPYWYLLNCVAGQEINLLTMCRESCADMEDVVKFVVPTVSKVRSHGANRMVRDTKVKYQGYVFAKLRLTRETYTAIQDISLCRSWMGTINMKGLKKLPPAPTPLSEEEIMNFDLENPTWEEDMKEPNEEAENIIVDTEELDMEEKMLENEIEQAVQGVYKGLAVEDMVKVVSKNKFFNEDGIVRRLKEGQVLVRFFTYGSTFDEWMDPTDVRKLSEAEVLKGLGGPSAPITQRDLENPRHLGGDQGGDNYDRRNDARSFGGDRRERRQDRNERRFRNDKEYSGATERDNWSWYQENERRDQDGDGYDDGEMEIRGSRERRGGRRDSWAESDVDSQWGRDNSQRQGRNDRQRRQPEDDWSSFVSRSSPSKERKNPTKVETDDFFASLISDLSNELGDEVGRGSARSNKNQESNVEGEDDFFASLMLEISTDQELTSVSSASSRKTKNDEDDFFATLEAEIRGSTQNKSGASNNQKKEFDAEKQLDDLIEELSTEMVESSTPGGVDDEDDFFASLEKELASDLEKGTVGTTSSTKQHNSDADFFLKLEAELDSSQDEADSSTQGGIGDDSFFSSLEQDLASEKTEAVITKQKPSESKQFDPAILQKHTIPKLKDMLKERGLKVSGNKAELIERLANC